MSGFRSVNYKITGTTESEVVGLIFKALDATDNGEWDRMMGRKPVFGPDQWRSLLCDGHWHGFIRNDSSGITLQLLYHFPDTLLSLDADPITLRMIWDRHGIKSMFYPNWQVNALISKWQSVIEEKFRTARLNYKQEY